jgi:glycogen debranching enzyme
MSELIGRQDEVVDIRQEAQFLNHWVNRCLWDSKQGFYHDLDRQGRLQTNVKSIGAYWALLAGAVPKAHLVPFISHLQNTNAFKRAHYCPSISADTPGFDPDGGYWRGGDWPPTNYMLLCGLRKTGLHELVFEFASNHLDNVVDAFQKTGTLWENYAPDEIGKGNSTPDFVGWSGLPPTAVLLEYVFGIQPDAPHNQLTWDIRLLDAYGVENYPFGLAGTLHLRCDSRKNYTDEPHVEITSNIGVNVLIRWAGGKKMMMIASV